MSPEQANENQGMSADTLSSYERSIYDDAYLNVPVRLIAQFRGFRGDAGRQEFHKKYQYILDLAHVNHQRDLRGAQWDLAVGDKNPTMLIFLGKQAGQSDLVATPFGDEAAEHATDPSVVNIVFPARPTTKEKKNGNTD